MSVQSDEKGQVAVTMTLLAKPGEETALMGALDALAATVRRDEAGCLLYLTVRSPHEPRRFLVFERYRDEQALKDHANSAHLRDALPGLMDCLESPPDVALFEAFDRD